MVKKQISDPIVIGFLKNLRQELDVKGVLLYGSRVRGTNTVDSDYDLIVISDDFKAMDQWDRISKLYDFWPEKRKAVDPLGYTWDEFQTMKKGINIVSEAAKEGIFIS
ncbi:nucleotidyltransferase domain-containing protein [Candidatus Gottesmanbacteria bacterium]|nr:nucleotidyltransferase domain-containing protein [Candidatus Gottesmanbacteria bacterium]